MLCLALVGPAAGQDQPTDQTLVYYNARLALREGRSVEAVKLWLLRNSIEDSGADKRRGRVSVHDADFHSVTWAALGDLGLCQDGHARDDEGAGLWPLALHNWVVKNMGRRKAARRPRPFDAFQLGRQQRLVSIGDVLSAQELSTVQLSRGRCLGPRLALLRAGESVTADLGDRQVAARLLRHLLERGRETLVHERVAGWAAVEARLFDLDLQLTALADRQARLDAGERSRRGRQVGLSDASIDAMAHDAPVSTLDPGSEAARVLRECVGWPVSEWMALSDDRRRFLFHHAQAQGGDPDRLDRLALGIIDRLIADGEGGQVEQWIALRVSDDGTAEDTQAQEGIWSGERGRALLALDREAGFDQRAVIALHRGVDHLERGQLADALRSLAFALQLAPESGASDDIASLSRRWLSYVAAQFEISDDLLVTLRELLPRRDYAIVLEDLMWRATFRADRSSFDRGVRNQQGRGALERRLDLLQPLASGDVTAFSARVEAGLATSPSETLRFLDQLVQRLELEDADVRRAQLPMLERVRVLLLPLASDGGSGGARGRSADALADRCQAIIEGLGGLGADASARDRAQSLGPQGEVFAGSVRLAPVDPLPWPFRASQPPAPSVFTPLELTPVEWRQASGELVFGWRVGG